MAPDCLSTLVGLCAAPLAIALSLPQTASADTPSWNGEYAITFMVGPKDGTSMAAGDPEGQHTETYGFRSSCTSGKCVATIVSGPAPSNPTVVRNRFSSTWDGFVLDASQRVPVGLHDARHHHPMGSGPIQCSLHAPSQRNTCRRHAHRHLERPVPGLDRDGHDGRARMTGIGVGGISPQLVRSKAWGILRQASQPTAWPDCLCSNQHSLRWQTAK